MNRFLKYIVFGIGCCGIGSALSGATVGQGNTASLPGNGQASLNQTGNEIAALPSSSDIATLRTGLNATSVTSGTGVRPYSAFYRQVSSQDTVYRYPASGPPRVARNFQSDLSAFHNNANASLTNQMSLGSNTATGNLGQRIPTNSQAPVYNMYPNAGLFPQASRNISSRSPVEQQRSSTISQRPMLSSPTVQLTSAQQAQAQAIQLARQAQAQQAQAQFTLAQAQQAQARAAQIAFASQPTVAYRQSIYQQPTLGLGSSQVRLAQNSNPSPAAFQAPALNQGNGMDVPPLNIQIPGQPGFNQPVLPANGQVCCQPNYQVQPGALAVPCAPRAYVPLLKLQNMPAGTYLGQGIIGQPTAYVDGQPVRNLLRYISP